MKKRLPRWLLFSSPVLLLTIVVVCFLVHLSRTKNSAYHSQCSSMMNFVAWCLHDYRSALGTFPPGLTTTEDDNRTKSWQDYYKETNGDDTGMSLRCPRLTQDSRYTFIGVIGKETIFPENAAVSWDEIIDGPGNTLLFLKTETSI